MWHRRYLIKSDFTQNPCQLSQIGVGRALILALSVLGVVCAGSALGSGLRRPLWL